MLTESNIRETGFIRTNSSKKLIPSRKDQEKSVDSDDSFSSFEYQESQKQYIKSNITKKNTNNNEFRQKQPSILKGPQVPKPEKIVINKPEFQNQKLKNNFFQQNKLQTKKEHQGLNQRQNDGKSTKPINTQKIPRMNTPQFLEQSKFQRDIQNVQNICSHIGNMKLEGNFSFNPKMQKFKGIENLQQQEEKYRKYQQILKKNETKEAQKNIIKSIKKPHKIQNRITRQNHYFKQNSEKFQYDDISDKQFQNPQQQGSQFSSSSSEQSYLRNYQIINPQDNHLYQNHFIHDKTSSKHIISKLSSNSQIQENKKSVISMGQKGYKSKGNNQQSFSVGKNVQNKKRKGQSVYVINNQQDQIINRSNSRSESFHQNLQSSFTQFNKKNCFHKNPSPSNTRAQKYLTQNHFYQNVSNKRNFVEPKDVFQTHGGVCFNIDVKQFNHPQITKFNQKSVQNKASNKKKKLVNQKQELLKRRKQALTYSKQARFRLFGFS